MNSESPQRLYARSLFEIAEESGSQERTLRELMFLRPTFQEFPEYAVLLDSPAVSARQRQELAGAAFGQALSPDTLGFLKLLIQNRRVLLAMEITDYYSELYNQYKNILNITATTAVPLEEEQRVRLAAALEKKTGKRVELDCRVEPGVIGGLLIEMEGSRIDATVKGELATLKKAVDELPA